MKKKIVTGFFLIVINLGAVADTSYLVTTLPMTTELNYETLTMPDGIEPMGVLGVLHLAHLSHGYYIGSGLSSAVTGEKGGYFTLTFEGGKQWAFASNWMARTAVRFGAGGGHSSPLGGGLFYEPLVGLRHHFNAADIGLYYSDITFPSGSVNSQQVGVDLSFHTSFSDFHPKSIGFNMSEIPNQSYVISIPFTVYKPQSNIKDDSGASSGVMSLVGLKVSKYITENWSVFEKFSGVFSGNQNGYADGFLGVDRDVQLGANSHWFWVGEAAVGAGGGGNVPTGGGFYLQPATGFRYVLTDHWSMNTLGGAIFNLNGRYDAWLMSAGLSYSLAVLQPEPDQSIISTNAQEYSWSMAVIQQTFFKPKVSSGETKEDMQLMGLDFQYDINAVIYGRGQMAYAYSGDQTGGYTTGLLGLGIRTPRWHSLSAFTAFSLGAGGGGGLDMGSGALYDAEAGLSVNVSDDWSVIASAGELAAWKGSFQSPVLTFALRKQWLTLAY